MKIAVCIKHVPSEQSRRRFEGGRLVRGEEDALNELDEHAIEAAVSLAESVRESGGEAEVVAVTMGPAGAIAAVRRALQVGADRGVLVTDERAAGSDVAATARILAAAIGRVGTEGTAGADDAAGTDDAAAGVDLVVTGATSTDGLTSMMPAALGAALGVPALTAVTDVALDAGTLEVTRLTPQARHRLRAPLPALVAVTDQANSPRHPNMKAMLAAKKKPTATLSLDDLGLAEAVAAGRAGGASSGVTLLEAQEVPPRTAGEIVQDTGDAGRRLARFLREHDLVPDRTA